MEAFPNPLVCCLSATDGAPREAWSVALCKADVPVVLVQPQRARHFARAVGRYAKTDPIDAVGLAQMALFAVERSRSGSRRRTFSWI